MSVELPPSGPSASGPEALRVLPDGEQGAEAYCWPDARERNSVAIVSCLRRLRGGQISLRHLLEGRTWTARILTANLLRYPSSIPPSHPPAPTAAPSWSEAPWRW